MISININGQTRDEIDESWIAQRVEGLRRDGQSVCVNVLVKAAGIDLRLTAGVCPPGAGGRPAASREQELIKMWNECGLGSSSEIPPGKLIDCLKRLARSL